MSSIFSILVVAMGFFGVEASPQDYEHQTKLFGGGRTYQIFWNSLTDYEISFKDNVRYEFQGGVLTEAIFGSRKHAFSETENCNSIPYVVENSKVNEVRTAGDETYDCDSCVELIDTVCTEGLAQVCDYADFVANGVGSATFSNWAKYSFPDTCTKLEVACENEPSRNWACMDFCDRGDDDLPENTCGYDPDAGIYALCVNGCGGQAVDACQDVFDAFRGEGLLTDSCVDNDFIGNPFVRGNDCNAQMVQGMNPCGGITTNSDVCCRLKANSGSPLVVSTGDNTPNGPGVCVPYGEVI